jgi:hypothetical protein
MCGFIIIIIVIIILLTNININKTAHGKHKTFEY